MPNQKFTGLANCLMEELNKDAGVHGTEHRLFTSRTKDEVLKGMRKEDLNTLAAQGMRKLSVSVPGLHVSMRPVVKEMKDGQKARKGWRRENLSKTARVLKELEEDNRETRGGEKDEAEAEEGEEKEERKPAARKTRGRKKKQRKKKLFQGCFPIHGALCH